METIELSAAMASILKDNANPASLLGLNGSDITKSTTAQIAQVVGGLTSQFSKNIVLNATDKPIIYKLFSLPPSSTSIEPASLIYRMGGIGCSELVFLSIINRIITDGGFYPYAKRIAGNEYGENLYYSGGDSSDIIVYVSLLKWTSISIPLFFNPDNRALFSLEEVNIDVATLTRITIE